MLPLSILKPWMEMTNPFCRLKPQLLILFPTLHLTNLKLSLLNLISYRSLSLYLEILSHNILFLPASLPLIPSLPPVHALFLVKMIFLQTYALILLL